MPPLVALKNIKKPNPEGGLGETTASAELLAQLTGHGVNEPKARWLVEHHRPEVIATQLAYLPHRRNMRDPAAALVRSIQENWEEPEGHRLHRKRAQEQEQYRREERQRIRTGQTAQAEKEAWERRKAALPPEQLAILQGQAEATVRRKLAQVWPADKPLPQTFVEAEFRSLVRRAAEPPSPDPSPQS
jgi:hypothetical protein